MILLLCKSTIKSQSPHLNCPASDLQSRLASSKVNNMRVLISAISIACIALLLFFFFKFFKQLVFCCSVSLFYYNREFIELFSSHKSQKKKLFFFCFQQLKWLSNYHLLPIQLSFNLHSFCVFSYSFQDKLLVKDQINSQNF